MTLRFLVLDEATSALDNLAEEAVMDAVHNIAPAKTVIIIANRHSTVLSYDKIVRQDRRVAQGYRRGRGHLRRTVGRKPRIPKARPCRVVIRLPSRSRPDIMFCLLEVAA